MSAVYEIGCNDCDQNYIGQTKDEESLMSQKLYFITIIKFKSIVKNC